MKINAARDSARGLIARNGQGGKAQELSRDLMNHSRGASGRRERRRGPASIFIVMEGQHRSGEVVYRQCT